MTRSRVFGRKLYLIWTNGAGLEWKTVRHIVLLSRIKTVAFWAIAMLSICFFETKQVRVGGGWETETEWE